MTVFRDQYGRFMVKEPAGGQGGGVTSESTRPATDDEIMAHHEHTVHRAKAEMQTAIEAHDEAKKALDEHRELQPVIVGVPPPPGPLDPNSVTGQGVGRPGDETEPGWQPLGNNTAEQGQPTQPGTPGTQPPAAPTRNMDPVPPPEPPLSEEADKPAKPMKPNPAVTGG